VLGKYRRNAVRCGLDRLYLVLSFDCDTPDDIAVAWDVHVRLLDMGICASYAVPGALLREGAGVYRRIADTGAEFLNHGGRSHAEFDHHFQRYRSTYFYDSLSPAEIEFDIAEGDRAIMEVIGCKAQGFRTPHFGTFQSPAQLASLHAMLGRRGYRFSSSTTPYYALRYGPAFTRFGLLELPVSGRGRDPMTILDTWGCFGAPDRSFTASDYKTDALMLADLLAGRSGILNYYADPSHIADQPIFFETMRALGAVAMPVSYRQVLERLA